MTRPPYIFDHTVWYLDLPVNIDLLRILPGNAIPRAAIPNHIQMTWTSMFSVARQDPIRSWDSDG